MNLRPPVPLNVAESLCGLTVQKELSSVASIARAYTLHELDAALAVAIPALAQGLANAAIIERCFTGFAVYG